MRFCDDSRKTIGEGTYRVAGGDSNSRHPRRRKWATERKDLPVKEVAAAGGWSDTETLLRSYQQADDATVTRVVLNAPKLTRKWVVG